MLDKPHLDLTTIIGRGLLAFLSALAQDECERITRRDGRVESRKRGARIGRKPKLTSSTSRGRALSSTRGFLRVRVKLAEVIESSTPLEFVDKDIDYANRIVLANPVFHASRKQRALLAIHPLNKALHPILCKSCGNHIARITSGVDRYWITSSAVANSDSRIVSPSVFAVLRLMTKLELGWLHDRQVGGFLALEDVADIDSNLAITLRDS
jgi:hypothetical protein